VDPREIISAMLGMAVGLLIALAVMVAFPPQAEVEQVLVKVPVPVAVIVPYPVPLPVPARIVPNEELGAFSDPAGEFYCFQTDGAGF
jgi:multidrug efflux pump subunit AcrA (membrane-fusion protein)